MKFFKCLLVLYLSIISEILLSQTDTSKFYFDITIRYRLEIWNGMNAKNYGDQNGVGSLNDNFLLQRVVAGFNYTPNNKIIISAHFQDSRAFGWSLRNAEYPDLFKIKKSDTDDVYYIRNPNEEFFEIHDLFLEYKGFLLDSLTIKVGRQKISFGDNRIY